MSSKIYNLHITILLLEEWGFLECLKLSRLASENFTPAEKEDTQIKIRMIGTWYTKFVDEVEAECSFSIFEGQSLLSISIVEYTLRFNNLDRSRNNKLNHLNTNIYKIIRDDLYIPVTLEKEHYSHFWSIQIQIDNEYVISF